MNLHKLLATKNYCYTDLGTITVKGIMVHSTGCNNPNLRRYVAPDDGLLGTPSSVHWNQRVVNGSVMKLGVHAFIGKLKDGTIATYQVQNWNHKCYHCGSGSKGSGNSTHIAFEICEDDCKNEAYCKATYKEAAELCAYLCKLYKLDPLTQITSHAEGHEAGIASNHGDPLHWWKLYGLTMDGFRQYVADIMEDNEMTQEKFNQMYKIAKAAYDAEVEKTSFTGTGTYAEEFAEAKSKGITDGTNPNGAATRAQVSVMCLRASKLK